MPGLAYEDENIYKLITPPQSSPQKPPLYRSKHNGRVNPKDMEMGVKEQRAAANFGKPLGAYVEPPDAFLKAHVTEPHLPDPAAPTRVKMRRKAPVPPRSERPVMGLHTDCNFIVANALDNISAEPKRSAPREVCWTSKPDFGQAPAYLQETKARIQREKDQLAAYLRLQEQQEKEAHVIQLPEEERQALLRALKIKWGAVNAAYQRLPFSLDTPAKQKRKEGYERQLTDIEKDIGTLSRSETVLVLQED